MPTAYVKKMAEKHHMTVDAVEKKWEEAKDAAKKYLDDPNYWGVVTSIFMKMVGEKK